MFVLCFFHVIYSPQASSYASQWPWTKVTATGEWHPANGRKDSSSAVMSPSSSVTTTYLPGSSISTSNEYQRFQQQMMAVNSGLLAGSTATSTTNSNSAGAKNQRMSSLAMGLGNVNASNNGAVNRNSVGVDVANKPFDAYPFLPPLPSQPLNAQNPLSPTHSPMRQQQQSPMSNQSMAQQQQQSPRSAFSLDRIAGTALQSNTNQKSNQSDSAEQSSSQQQQQPQHNPMLSPTRHLPFPYSNLNNYHRNF